MAKLDPGENLARRFAGFAGCNLVGAADGDAPGVAIGAVLGGPSAEQAAVAPSPKTKAEAFQLGIPGEFLGPALRERQAGDGLGVEFQFHGAPRAQSVEALGKQRVL